MEAFPAFFVLRSASDNVGVGAGRLAAPADRDRGARQLADRRALPLLCARTKERECDGTRERDGSGDQNEGASCGPSHRQPELCDWRIRCTTPSAISTVATPSTIANSQSLWIAAQIAPTAPIATPREVQAASRVNACEQIGRHAAFESTPVQSVTPLRHAHVSERVSPPSIEMRLPLT